MTVRLTSLLHRDVLDVATASVVARVEGLILDDAHGIAALVVGKGPKGATVLPWARIVAVGPDAVTIDGIDALRPPASEREERFASGTIDPLGARLLSDGGDAGGELTDLELDTDTGQLSGLVAGSDVLDPSRLVGIGDYAVIVRR